MVIVRSYFEDLYTYLLIFQLCISAIAGKPQRAEIISVSSEAKCNLVCVFYYILYPYNYVQPVYHRSLTGSYLKKGNG